jgi:hypothetical protein
VASELTLLLLPALSEPFRKDTIVTPPAKRLE